MKVIFQSKATQHSFTIRKIVSITIAMMSQAQWRSDRINSDIEAKNELDINTYESNAYKKVRLLQINAASLLVQ